MQTQADTYIDASFSKDDKRQAAQLLLAEKLWLVYSETVGEPIAYIIANDVTEADAILDHIKEDNFG
jgi:hypothetical protein